MTPVTWTRKAVGGLAILACSYLFAAFFNAAPITQPSLANFPMSRATVVVIPAPDAATPADGRPVQAASPDKGGEPVDPAAHARLQAI
jgi:hypothetical protein